MTIEGGRQNILAKRVAAAKGDAAVFGQINTSQDPIGVPMKVASDTIMTEPKIEFASPPTSLGGGVISVNRAKDKPPRPKRMVSHKIQISQNNPNAIAMSERVRAT
jgi:hypothetical protein